MFARTQAVDMKRLTQMMGDDAEMSALYLRESDKHATALVAHLQSVLDQRDAPKWRQTTQELKDLAESMGAKTLARAAARAEPVDPVRDRGTASLAILDIKQRLAAVHALVEEMNAKRA